MGVGIFFLDLFFFFFSVSGRVFLARAMCLWLEQCLECDKELLCDELLTRI